MMWWLWLLPSFVVEAVVRPLLAAAALVQVEEGHKMSSSSRLLLLSVFSPSS
jgi:hypothetical protein